MKAINITLAVITVIALIFGTTDVIVAASLTLVVSVIITSVIDLRRFINSTDNH